MDPETFDEQTDQTPAKAAEPPVEIMVETEAEAGASGYSVTGGGERGIFIKDVLKDSPAAKHLSLQQGDQLLSAKVYFDNVRYEDALKILQCAEPYKVSFLVKRTIQGEDVYLRPRLPSVDIKVPNTKMAKMSVKAIKPFKAKKKRGGRFGLRRLKEKRREELVIEGTPPRLDISDVDVEFCLPKFKHRQSGHLEADGDSAAKAKRKIRFPGMKIKGQSGGKEDTGRLEAKVKVSPAEIPAAKVKAKGKAPKFGINFPKSKDAKSGSVELKKPGVNIASPSFEFSLPAGKGVEVEMGGASLNSPDVEFALPSIQADASLPAEKGKVEIKGPKVDVRRADAKVSMGKVDVETGKGDGKLQMPKLKLPKMRLSRHLDEKDDKMKVKAEGEISVPTVEIKGGSGIVVPEVNVTKGNVPSLPSVDISLPKVKGTSGMDVKTSIKKPGMDFSVPDVDLHVGRIPDEVEGTFKGPGISMPTLDISLPKMGSSNLDVDGAESRGKFSLPSAEIGVDMSRYIGGDGTFSLPSFDVSQSQKAHLKGPDVKGEFKMPSVDLTLPKGKDVDLNVPSISLPEGNVKLKGPEFKAGRMEMPDIDVSLPKGKLEGGVELQGPDIQGGKFKMPSLDVSLPKVNLPEGGVKLKGPEFKGAKMDMPDIDVSLPKGKLEGGVELQGPDVKGGKFKMPTLDVSLPKVNLPEGGVKLKGPELKGKMDIPDVDVSLPKGKLEGGVELQGPDVKGGKFKMPTLDVSLPKVNLPEGGVKLKGPEFKGAKIDMPDIDVSLPKVEGDLDIEGPDVKGGKFKLPTFDVSLPKVNLPEGGVKLKGPQFKGKMDMPDADVSLPKGQLEGGVELQGPDVKGAKFKMPSLDVSLPKVNLPEGGVKIKGPDLDGRKIEMPDLDIEGPDFRGGQIKMPKLDVSLPKMSLPGGGVKMKGPDLGEVSLKGKTEGEMGIDGHLGKGGKFHLPSVDFSLPKMKTKGPEINIEGLDGKGGKVTMPTMDVSLPKVQGELDLQGPDIRGGKFKKPTVDVSLPKVSLPESGVKLQGPEFRGKMEAPDVDISIPKIEGDIEGPHIKGGKFKMPTIDVSLPKVNLPEGGVKLKGPEFKGAKMDMPDIDVSFPKGKLEGGVQLQGPDVKGGKFKMPSLDISLPKVNLPEGGVKLKGPKISGGKTGMADLDVSFPKGKVEGEIGFEGHVGKEGKFHMPAVDISLPKVKTKAPEINIEGPDVKGVKVTLPTVDVSLPKVEGDLDLEGPDVRGGKFKIPTWDISLPKVNLPEGGLRMKGPELKGGKMEIPDMDVSLPKGKVEGDVDFEGPDLKGGKLKMPKIDVSLPKVNLPEGNVKLKGPEFKGAKMDMPDIDVSLPKGKAEGEMRIEGHVDKGGKFHMPSVDISLPKMKAKGPHINIEEHEIKGGKVTMPTVDVSLPTIKSPEVDFSLEGPDVKGGKRGAVKLPTVDISAPKVDLDFGLTKPKGDDVEVALLKAEGSRPSSGGSFDLPHVSLKAPSFTLPRFGGKSKSGRLEVSGQSSEGDISLKAPSVELGLDSTVKGKKAKLKTPSFGISPTDADVSVSCPEFDVNTKKGGIAIPKPDVDVEGKGHFHAPDVTIKFPKFSMPGKPSGDLEAKAKARMPSVELSLPATKSPEMEVLLPKAEVDVSQCDIQTYEGHLKIPKKPGIDVTVPKVDLDVPLPKIKLESSSERGAKFKMPDVDLSLPKGKIGSLPKSKSLKMEAPEVELKMQSIDVSLPKPPEADVHGDGRGTFKTPRADIDLPEATMPKADISMKMPRLDITGPKGDLELDLRLRKGDTKVDVSDVETNSKVRGPKVKGTKFNIGMPKKKNGGGVKVEVSGLASTNHNGHKEGNVNVQMPGVALPSAGVKSQEGSAERGLPSSSSAVPRIPDIDFDIGTAQDEDEDKLGKRIKIPKFGVPLPSLSSPEGRLELCGSEIKQEGPKIKKAVFVLVNPPQTDNVTLNTGDVKVKTSKFQTKTMETSVSTTGTSVWASPVKTEDPMSRFHFEKDSRPHKVFKSEDVAASGKVKLPKVEFTSPYGKKAAGDANFEMATRLGKPSLSGEAPKGLQIKPGKVSFEGFAEESSREVVSHHSRTERLDQDTFGSPAAFTMGFSSTKVQTWSEGDTIEDPQGTEAPSWFKVPKVTLKPHSTGFLQITPEGSPQAQRRGELGGEANLSGSFCQQSSDDVTTREVSSPRGGGSVTVVTKTTRTKQHSTPAGTSAGHWLGTTHPPSDL
ncbi:neuroblast differentiation-associated protein AHNAK isoform X24 [Syngnathus acus]|uniref:neuroblast differentiation-associated protein AHNAK isoform X24 n=1 Tax=Syngnathus acus TaxID=161584 RepID=UPI001886467E|nr:neuroblast differentiation-associated protein AHNAK isoform X24 [Syngnathus acus]